MKLIRAPRSERFPTTEFDIKCMRGDCEAIYRVSGSELPLKPTKFSPDLEYHFKCPSCNEEIFLDLEELDKCEVTEEKIAEEYAHKRNYENISKLYKY